MSVKLKRIPHGEFAKRFAAVKEFPQPYSAARYFPNNADAQDNINAFTDRCRCVANEIGANVRALVKFTADYSQEGGFLVVVEQCA